MLLLLGTVFCLTGCGIEQHTDISVEKNTMDTTGKIYLTTLERAKFDVMKKLYHPTLQGKSLDEITWAQETKDGNTYQTVEQTRSFSVDDFAGNIVLDEDKFIIYSNKNGATITSVGLVGEILNQDPEFFRSVFSFDRNVLDTNGTLEGKNQVVFSTVEETKQNIIYACFTEKSAKCRRVEADAGRYTKKPRIKFKTDGIVMEIRADGQVYRPHIYYENPVLHRDYYDFDEEKTCQITVVLSSGYQKKFTFTYDKTAPKVLFKKNKLTVTDKNGIKKITLNGQKISNGKRITRKGEYKVKAWDNAGNLTNYCFKVK